MSIILCLALYFIGACSFFVLTGFDEEVDKDVGVGIFASVFWPPISILLILGYLRNKVVALRKKQEQEYLEKCRVRVTQERLIQEAEKETEEYYQNLRKK